MIFKKPENVRYVDMAKYVDENAYRDDKDESLIYEYIFHLCNMLSHKRKLFVKNYDYEDFAIYMSGYVMSRYKNKKQFIIEDGTPRMSRVKSVLNYIKKTIYQVSLRYKSENYVNKKPKIEDIDLSNVHNFRDSLLDSSSKLSSIDFDLYVNSIPKTIWEHVKKTPYTGVELKNIYISCMLTMMSWMTLSTKNERRVKNLSKYAKSLDDLLCALYEQERKTQVVLYDIDDDMRDYIRVLCNRIRNIIIGDINYLLTTSSSESDLRDLLQDCIENV